MSRFSLVPFTEVSVLGLDLSTKEIGFFYVSEHPEDTITLNRTCNSLWSQSSDPKSGPSVRSARKKNKVEVRLTDTPEGRFINGSYTILLFTDSFGIHPTGVRGSHRNLMVYVVKWPPEQFLCLRTSDGDLE